MKVRLYIPWPHGSGLMLLKEMEHETKPGAIVSREFNFRVFVRAGMEREDGGLVFPQEAGDKTNVVRYVQADYLIADVPRTPSPEDARADDPTELRKHVMATLHSMGPRTAEQLHKFFQERPTEWGNPTYAQVYEACANLEAIGQIHLLGNKRWRAR